MIGEFRQCIEFSQASLRRWRLELRPRTLNPLDSPAIRKVGASSAFVAVQPPGEWLASNFRGNR